MDSHIPIIRFFHYNNSMPITTIFFDLDDTLYPASSGVWKLVKQRMDLFMHEQLGISMEMIPSLREDYFAKYGTTLRGLQKHYQVDSDHYLSYVHDIPVSQYLDPDPETKNVLDELPHRKYVFTNADADHANRVLDALGFSDCFESIIDIRRVDPYCKPMTPAFNIALDIAGETSAANCVLIDDLPATTKAGKKLGFYTILFGKHIKNQIADAYLDDLKGLPAIISRI
ncbi:pyrimidine 5'-nucleotidase [Chloroflexota bacterium]